MSTPSKPCLDTASGAMKKNVDDAEGPLAFQEASKKTRSTEESSNVIDDEGMLAFKEASETPRATEEVMEPAPGEQEHEPELQEEGRQDQQQQQQEQQQQQKQQQKQEEEQSKKHQAEPLVEPPPVPVLTGWGGAMRDFVSARNSRNSPMMQMFKPVKCAIFGCVCD